MRALIEMESESPDGELPFAGDVAARAGLAPQLGSKLADRLAVANYIRASVQRDGAGRIYVAHITQVGERARRAVGQWPSEDPVARLLQLLDDQIAGEPDEERRSKLERLRHALAEGAKNVGGNVLANLIVLAASGGVGS